MSNKTFYSNGKLLITGEYLVLDGAQAFALPTKYGQRLVVEKGEGYTIHWKSYDSDGSIWFEDNIPFSAIVRNEQFDDNKNIKNTLILILHEAYLMNSNFIKNGTGYQVVTQLTFPKKWGLGTSSTLINNIAQWLQIDAFKLLKRSFGGSGYDIACAQNNSGIIYQVVNDNPIIKTINFKPDFTDKIFFVYLNKKQNSRNAIKAYYSLHTTIDKTIPIINSITQKVVQAVEPKEFGMALQQHEIELSNVLKLATIKETLFPDFDGVIKSLGAWGGDFALSISKEDPTAYFKLKGFETIVPYEEMILV